MLSITCYITEKRENLFGFGEEIVFSLFTSWATAAAMKGPV